MKFDKFIITSANHFSKNIPMIDGAKNIFVAIDIEVYKSSNE